MHWTKDKPFLDEEGRALGCLEAVVFADVNGPLKEKALFYLGTVHFFRENYREADHFYTQLYRNTYPHSTLAPKAIKQSIICKQVVNGGSKYDRRTLEQARKLIDDAIKTYPELEKEHDWLKRQLQAINYQQADGDFNTAEFYKRIGRPGSAYFYYELVRRRYTGSEFADRAIARMTEIKAKAEQDVIAQKKADDDLRNRPPQTPSSGSFFSQILPASWRRPDPATQPQSSAMPGEQVRN